MSSLPRGSLQIVQPARLPDPLLRNYSREFHAYDCLTWQAAARGQPLRAADVWPDERAESSRYLREFLRGLGITCAVAVPLASPVFDSYPGALHLYRDASRGEFSDEELRRLSKVAADLHEAILRVRSARAAGYPSAADVLPRRAPGRIFVLNAALRCPLPPFDPALLDEHMRRYVVEDAHRRLAHVDSRDLCTDRVSIPDSRGDLWNFRVAVHRRYPAFGEGPLVFYCLQPSCCDWNVLRPADFQADNEIMRLIPALRFMREQFHRGPTLNEIARAVHLSSFHFHRRFTELLGITPKHFLLDCQISQAKRDLLTRKKNLVKIATECGFAHQSHFTSRFKQATGLTPTRWRRMALGVQRTSNN